MKASNRPLFTRHEPRKSQGERTLDSNPSVGCSSQETEGRSVTLQEATESTKTKKSAEEQEDREGFDQEECLKRTEKLHTQETVGRRKKETVAKFLCKQWLVSVLPIARESEANVCRIPVSCSSAK